MASCRWKAQMSESLGNFVTIDELLKGSAG